MNPNIAILINGTSINHLEGLKTGVTNEDEIVILQTAAGG
ncbi:MAG: MoaD/ThiS family protein [Candidatus Hydrothermarchaeaceae archaeon]